MKKNITPVMHELLESDELISFKDRVGIFDREFNSEMTRYKCYAPLAENKWDTFRDL